MAMSGPQHYKRAEDLVDEARFEKDPTQRAIKYQEAHTHATLASLVAAIQCGHIAEEVLHEWRVHGMKI